jgi:predicted secreted protein
MVEPISLNRMRKARARDAARAQAAENRVRFGRSGAEKAVTRLEAEQARRALDGAKRED